jgi:hypothetical protein
MAASPPNRFIVIRWIVEMYTNASPSFGLGEQGVGHDVGVERLVTEVRLLKALGVDGVDLVELQARLGLVGAERPDGLRGQGPAVDEEQHAPRDAGLHQPVDLVDRHQRLARPGGHRDEHPALVGSDRVLDRPVRVDLVRPEPRVRWDRAELRQLRVQVAVEQLAERVGGVECRHVPGAVQLAAHVVEADHLAVGRVQEWHSILALVAGLLPDAARVSLSLGQHPFGPDRELLRLDHPEHAVVGTQGVVSRAVVGRELGQRSRRRQLCRVQPRRIRDRPSGRPQLWVDSAPPCISLALRHGSAIVPAHSTYVALADLLLAQALMGRVRHHERWVDHQQGCPR